MCAKYKEEAEEDDRTRRLMGLLPGSRREEQSMECDLHNVFPWGRSLRDYVRMFDLSGEDLDLKILGCADGPASFNSEMKKRACNVVSCDPLYQFSAQEIRARIDAVYEDIIEETRQRRDSYVWTEYESPEGVGRMRMAAMQKFLADYEKGKKEGRYLRESLPSLPFPDNSFDLALCSHFLFTYSHVLTLEFHAAAMKEMCRVAAEVRVFPLMDFHHSESAHVQPVVRQLNEAGYVVDVKPVPYEFQRGGNKMMRVTRRSSRAIDDRIQRERRGHGTFPGSRTLCKLDSCNRSQYDRQVLRS